MRKLFDGTIDYSWAIDHNFLGRPETVIHYAEQPSAPYSMMNFSNADLTITNNLRVLELIF